MSQVFLNITLFGMDPQSAVDAPRFASYDFLDSFEPHARLPGRIAVESDIGEGTIAQLRAMGHDAVAWPSRTWRAGGVCVISHDPRSGIHSAGADPRRTSYALSR
jgi:gamma-glutamyltranspeptidase/glutathione hydrolase